MWCCSCDLVSNDYSFSSGFNCSLVSALPSISLVDDWHAEDRVPILPQRLVSSTSFISLPTPRSTMDALIQLSTRLLGCWSDLERRSCLRNFQNSRPENEGPNSTGRKCGKELRSHIFRPRILQHVPKTRLFSFQTHGFAISGPPGQPMPTKPTLAVVVRFCTGRDVTVQDTRATMRPGSTTTARRASPSLETCVCDGTAC